MLGHRLRLDWGWNGPIRPPIIAIREPTASMIRGLFVPAQRVQFSSMGDNAAEEMFVFREFAKACPLPLLIDTAESRNPPEPDILCDLSTGGKVAFELVEADDVTSNKAKP